MEMVLKLMELCGGDGEQDSDGSESYESSSDVAPDVSQWPAYHTYQWPVYHTYQWPVYHTYQWPAYHTYQWPVYCACACGLRLTQANDLSTVGACGLPLT